MKKLTLLNTAFIFSLLLFNYFFWKENLGVNLLIFSVLLIGFLLANYSKALSSTNVKITLAGTLISSLMVLIFNSTESKIVQILSFMLMVGFIHETGLRSVMYSGMHMLSSLINVPYSFYSRKKLALKKLPKAYFVLRIVELSLIPLAIAFVFFLLYCLANPIFGNYADIFFEKFFKALSTLFGDISFARIMFIIFGAFILSAIYYRNEVKIFLERDLSFSEKLERMRAMRKRPTFKIIALKNQNRRGIILLIMVNFLLFIENIIDVKWLWLGFELPSGFSLQHYVREGVGFLIVSILLSISILLYFFRKNQNFYSKNSLLKTLAYAWIVQNMILSLSVLLRNYHYIDFHGLAYKRIGVIVFISLTVFGLITLYFKIRKVKSLYYLLRMNTWAVYFSLIILSCFNWDVDIAKYNLAHWNKGEVDVDFYLQLSDKALPVVFQNLDSVKEQIEAHKNNKVRWITYLDYDAFVRDLEVRRKDFIQEYEKHSWLSYNFQDQKAFEKLSVQQLSER